MSRREYTVGYYDGYGELRLAFKTPTHLAQARKRLAKVNKDGGVCELLFDDTTGLNKGTVRRIAFLVSREISDWKAEANV